MKIFGKTISKPSDEIIVIPREEGDIVFTASAVLDYEEFLKICPEPNAPIKKNVKTGVTTKALDNKKYLKAVEEHADHRMNYTIIKSLSATKGLEWEQVDISDPTTYKVYSVELEESGLTQMEVNKLIEGVLIANCLDDSKYKEARARFLASQSKKA